MIKLTLIAAMVLGTGDETVSVQGVVLSDRDEPVVGVKIEILELGEVVWSDSTGAYKIAGLEPGEHQIRFTQFGYHPLELTVTVPEDGSVSLDVRLRTRPIVQPRISVLTPTPTSSAFDPSGLPEVGSRTITGEALWLDPLAGQPDLLETMRTVPGIDMMEEFPTQFHVRGGSADENLVLLDGVPVYNPYHTSGVLSAITPDAVSRASIHTGVFPARYGGRLSSVVDVTTPEPGQTGTRFRGGIGLADLRMTTEVPFPGERGGVLVGGRRTTYDFRGHVDEGASSEFEDAIVKVSLDLFGGKLEVLSLHADNSLSSEAGESLTSIGLAGAGDRFEASHHPVHWSNGTDALSWSRTSFRGTETRFQLWRASTGSDLQWGDDVDRYRAVNFLEHLGISADVSWQGSGSVGRWGVALERLSSSYTAEQTNGELEAPGSDLALNIGPDPVIASSYVEHRWIPRDRWMINNGVRLVWIEGHGAEIEPRISAHFRPRQRVMLSGGYARVHQYVQSLRNEESLINVAWGVEPLVAAGKGGIPVGRSDQLTASLEVTPSERVTLTLDGYTRWLDGIVLVAPETTHPLVTEGFATGSGRSWGTAAGVVYRGDRTDADAIVEWNGAERETTGVKYHPGFERSRSLAAAVSYRVTERTRVRTAFQAAKGRPTSTQRSGFDWEPFDQLSGEVEFTGTPHRASAALNSERLPSYIRVDFGLRKEWRPTVFGRSGSLTGYLDVTNVLSRKNILGYQAVPSDTGWREFRLLPVSASLGFEWSF